MPFEYANGQTLTTEYQYYADGCDKLEKEINTGPVACVPVGDEHYYAYAGKGGGIIYKSLTGGRIGGIMAFMMGLPNEMAEYMLAIMLICVPISFLAPAAVRIIGRKERRERGGLSLYHRSLCALLAYVMLISPWGLESIANASCQYSQISVADWATHKYIEYTYDDNGSCIAKTTKNASNAVVESVQYDYDLQNKLERVTRQYTEGSDNIAEVTQYTYNDDGIRVRSEYYRTVNGGAHQDEETKTFLIDAYNHTGYAQVLEESDGVNRTTYTIGDDIVTQSNFNGTAASIRHILYDGHGSTRQLTDNTGALITDQVFNYDGYGVMVGYSGTPQTNLLYTGQQYDKSLEQYYLRARYYNPGNGLFNQVDPYSGNLQDPQSLHKYLYCHANPVNGVDPTGREFSLTGMLITASISGLLSSTLVGTYGYAKGWSARQIAKMAGYAFLTGAVAGAFAYGAAAAIAAGAVGAGATAGEAAAVGWTSVGLIGGPTSVGLSIANVHEAFENGDSTDRAFAVVNMGLASFGFIAAHWSAFNLAAGTTAASLPQATQNYIAGEAAEADFVANAQANGFTIAGRKVSIDTPFGRRVIDVVLRDPKNPTLNYGVEVKSSVGAFNRNDAAARHQFAADRYINQYGAEVVGEWRKQGLTHIAGTSKILWRPE